MNPDISGPQLKQICNAGNLINIGCESADFAEVRKALDTCIVLIREMGDADQIDPYLVAKMTLAFTAGLAVTEQSALLSNLFELGKLFNQDEIVLRTRCQLDATYDGMNFDTELSPNDLRLLAMGIYLTCHSDTIMLQPRDAMVMLQVRLIEMVLRKRRKTAEGTFKKADEKKLEESFLQNPEIILEYLRHDDPELVSQLIAFWEYSLQLAYGSNLPEQCSRAFGERLRNHPVYERHNHIRLLPMLPWAAPEKQTEDAEEFEMETDVELSLESPASQSPMNEMPAIGRPIKATLLIYGIVVFLAESFSGMLLWVTVAVTLASIFYRVCLNFREEMNEGSVAIATYFVYLFAGFMSIGAFSVEGLAFGMLAAVSMHVLFPLFFGILLVGRRKFLNGMRSLFKNSANKRRLR